MSERIPEERLRELLAERALGEWTDESAAELAYARDEENESAVADEYDRAAAAIYLALRPRDDALPGRVRDRVVDNVLAQFPDRIDS